MAAPSQLPAARAVPYGNMAEALVQYVVLRGDLARPPRLWPLGAVVAQGCHAALAAVHGYREHPDTGAYLELGAAMRTVVLEAPDENSLLDLAESLKEKGVEHRLWMENPEGIPTCLALRPYPKNQLLQEALPLSRRRRRSGIFRICQRSRRVESGASPEKNSSVFTSYKKKSAAAQSAPGKKKPQKFLG